MQEISKEKKDSIKIFAKHITPIIQMCFQNIYTPKRIEFDFEDHIIIGFQKEYDNEGFEFIEIRIKKKNKIVHWEWQSIDSSNINWIDEFNNVYYFIEGNLLYYFMEKDK